MKGPHAGMQYLGLTFATTGDASGSEGLPMRSTRRKIPPSLRGSSAIRWLIY